MTPNSLIIFGFTGDLSKRKLLPALYTLELQGKLHENFHIVGITRHKVDMGELKDELNSFITSADGEACNVAVLDKLCDRIDLADADISKPEDFASLKEQIDALMPSVCEAKLFYFALPPSMFEGVIENMVENDIHKCGNGVVSRLLIEKPFGHSLESAKHLLDVIERNFGKESIYPIDHYLAKDTAQNILYFRFHNPIVRNIWDNSVIRNIQVSAVEELDIQGRGDFYEETGALRDMIQGHLIQLLALVTMDEPASLTPEDVRRQRQLAISSIKPISEEMVGSVSARGQYDGYKNEVGNDSSNIETFAALKLEIDSTRWRGVPMFLRAGKAMEAKFTEINVTFYSDEDGVEENILTFRLQPSEGIAISLSTKKPGLDNEHEQITLDYCFSSSSSRLSQAYERILHDAIMGDPTLFPTDQEILASWGLMQPVLDVWSGSNNGLEVYRKGSREVSSANALIERAGGEWVHHESWVCSFRPKGDGQA